MTSPSIQTLGLIAIFALLYLFAIFRKTAHRKLDLYDLFMLSMVAVIPAFFVFLPSAATMLADLTGVAFPFVIMFGALFAILFIFVHRLTSKMHKVENDSRLLIQEISMLRQQIEHRNPSE